MQFIDFQIHFLNIQQFKILWHVSEMSISAPFFFVLAVQGLCVCVRLQLATAALLHCCVSTPHLHRPHPHWDENHDSTRLTLCSHEQGAGRESRAASWLRIDWPGEEMAELPRPSSASDLDLQSQTCWKAFSRMGNIRHFLFKQQRLRCVLKVNLSDQWVPAVKQDAHASVEWRNPGGGLIPGSKTINWN